MGDQKLVTQVIAANGVGAIIHLAGSIVVPDLVRDPTRVIISTNVQIAHVDCLCHQGKAEALYLLFERCGLWCCFRDCGDGGGRAAADLS